jgi:glutaredoxin
MRRTANITIYGAYWCSDCRRSKQFLGEHQLPYNRVDIKQNKIGEQYVLQKNKGKRIIPTLLFHCYDIEGLPRTNNDLESHFRDTQRRLLRTTGQKGQTRRALQRTGAWELLLRPPIEARCLAASQSHRGPVGTRATTAASAAVSPAYSIYSTC